MSNKTLFTLSGTTKHFKGDGRKLGYPTANIDIPANTPEGLFVGVVEFDAERHNATIFVGAPVTMGDARKRAEAHILDFPDKDLYGTKMTFYVQHKLRDNRLFDSPQELVKQMRLDEHRARTYFKRDKQA